MSYLLPITPLPCHTSSLSLHYHVIPPVHHSITIPTLHHSITMSYLLFINPLPCHTSSPSLHYHDMPPLHQSITMSYLFSITPLPCRDPLSCYGHKHSTKKRRKSRTAFTNHQIYELEKRFLYQKYLSPADRDHIAQQLGLSNSQVITWFQNRRAKLKRDIEEMKADVESLKKLPPHALDKLTSLPEVEVMEEEEDVVRGYSPISQRIYLQSPHCSSIEHTVDEFSDNVEIEVDD
ncbi:transcription factor LBX1-like [Pelobates cultripes]|uniref:Transcription factor LBX1-like n=1 Tax=Pelobates cultripes TaxID=61616 RepID=A0AAD1W9G2_PELCU|nr:transcription factor LBX1-like [Pelobates cultripes]